VQYNDGGEKMVAGEIELKETELLLMQHLLGGENFGAGYDDFRNKGLSAAQFQAEHRGNMYTTDVVGRAAEGGRLNELNFSIELPLDEEDESAREIDITAYRDGYFRSDNNTPTKLVDRFFGNLAIILQYRNKLTPLNQLLDNYIEEKSFGLDAGRDTERMKKSRAFENLIKDKFSAFEVNESEIAVYQSIIANVGIELCKLNLADDEYPNITGFDGDSIDYNGGDISEFFNVYATFVEDGYRPDFDLVAGHLYHIMTNSDEYNSLNGMLNYIEDTYDI
jgi:hypothetical protein